MHSRLGSATLLQLAFPEKSNLNFAWEKSYWDNTVVKKVLTKRVTAERGLHQTLERTSVNAASCTKPMPSPEISTCVTTKCPLCKKISLEEQDFPNSQKTVQNGVKQMEATPA